jgi:Glycosyl hydrolase family 76
VDADSAQYPAVSGRSLRDTTVLARIGATLGVLACCAQLAGAPAPAYAASASASAYPAAAQRPRLVAHRGQYAHGAANGGTSPGQRPSGQTRKSAPRKPTPAKPALHGNPARALVAYQAMQKAFYIPGSGLYEGEPYSYLWPFSQALAATVSVAEMPGQAHASANRYQRELHIRLYGLGKYWGPAGQTLPGKPREGEEEEQAESAGEEGDGFVASMPSFNGNVVPPGGISYYDDNEWVGLELVRLYKLRREPAVLERAEQIMAFVMSGWQSSPKLACAGGVPFSDSPNNTDRNTVTNGPAAELALQLYLLTKDTSYLLFGHMTYEWVRHCLATPNGLYADHIRPHGAINQALWSYNQGTMIGAGAMLYQATGEGHYLIEAKQTAQAALAYFTMERLLAENPFFVSVYFRNLMYLDALNRDPTGRRLAQAYVDHAWVAQRLKSNLFVFGSPPSSQLLVQAAIVQIYALLSEPTSKYF